MATPAVTGLSTHRVATHAAEGVRVVERWELQGHHIGKVVLAHVTELA